MEEKIRGAALGAFARWYSREGGGDRLRRSLAGLSPEQRVYFDATRPDLGVRSDRWYPASAVHRVLEGTVRDLAPSAVDELIRGAAEAITRESLSGFLAFLFRLFVSPQVCRMFSQQHWNFHYQSGRVAFRPAGSKAQRMEVWDWRSHHSILCRLAAAAGVPIIRATGCRGVTSRIEACVDLGDPCCVYWTQWQ